MKSARLWATFAEMRWKHIGDRTKEGMARVARQGRARSRWLPWGYRVEGEPERTTAIAGDRRPLVPHEREQEILDMVIEHRINGLGGHAIATKLNAAGIHNPRTGRPWNHSGMRSMIRTLEKHVAEVTRDDKPMKVIGYVRTSTAHQDTSLATQESAIKDFCTKNGHELVKMFVERGVTGRAHVRNRKVGAQVIEALDGVDGVVTMWTDRWTRAVDDPDLHNRKLIVIFKDDEVEVEHTMFNTFIARLRAMGWTVEPPREAAE